MLLNSEFPNSSMLSHCSYDDETKELIVYFNGGKEYTYVDVPLEIYDNLIGCASAGKYFNSIKATLTQKQPA